MRSFMIDAPPIACTHNPSTLQRIFLKIFQLSRETRPLFNLTAEEDIHASIRFVSYATITIDEVNQLEHRDDKILMELTQLGVRHVKFGVDKELFLIFGKAVEHALYIIVIVYTYTTEQCKFWHSVFKVVTEKMVKGCDALVNLIEKKTFSVEFDTATTHSADNISYNDGRGVTLSLAMPKEMENFKDVAGDTIFEGESSTSPLFGFDENEIIKANSSVGNTYIL